MDLQAIVDTAAREFWDFWKRGAHGLRLSERTNFQVDLILMSGREDELVWPLMRGLARRVPSEVIFLPLDLPVGVDAARSEIGPVRMRAIRSESFMSGEWLTAVRFEVLVEPA